jgi:twitching motility protein PilT
VSLLDEVQLPVRGLQRLDTALSAVIGMKGSDLHVAAGATPMVRVSGALRPVRNVGTWSAEDVRSILTSAMSADQLARFEQDLELDFAYALGDQARFRVNVYQQRESWGAAFRLIPTEIKTVTDLGLPESISSFADLARGLVLVTGPTGSGKSTTLAALIDRANETRADHIMTIEDPIEFVHTSKTALVNQREVGTDTHSFGEALKHVLRQDPDIILLGELRDLESISVALTAAETGHLVFATLHTSDAAQSIDRIVDVFSADQQQQVRMQLSMVLQGVVCQTLIPRADGQGRAVATEILRVTPAIGNLIRTGKTSQLTTAMQTGSALGMQTMDQNLVELVHSGVITIEAAEAKAQDLNTLRQMVGNAPAAATPKHETFAQMGMGGFR